MKMSIVIPVLNEEETLEEKVLEICSFLKKRALEYEVILIDNESIDQSPLIIKNLCENLKGIRSASSTRGIGNALRKGFKEARHEIIFFTAADLPFGLKVIEESLNQIKDFDMVIGSKGHPQSSINIPISRMILSSTFRFLLKTLFRVSVKDPQGSLMFHQKVRDTILHCCSSANSFFETQFVIYAERMDFSILEIPVEYISLRKKSRFNLFSESLGVFINLLREFIQIHFRRTVNAHGPVSEDSFQKNVSMKNIKTSRVSHPNPF